MIWTSVGSFCVLHQHLSFQLVGSPHVSSCLESHTFHFSLTFGLPTY